MNCSYYALFSQASELDLCNGEAIFFVGAGNPPGSVLKSGENAMLFEKFVAAVHSLSQKGRREGFGWLMGEMSFSPPAAERITCMFVGEIVSFYLLWRCMGSYSGKNPILKCDSDAQRTT